MSDRQLILSALAREVRRSISKVAWEALLELAWEVDEAGEVRSSARQLGTLLGSSKDTANRAINELVASGFVAVYPDRSTSTSGGTALHIELDLAGITIAVDSPPAPVRSSETPSTDERATARSSTCPKAKPDPLQQPSHGHVEQLDLFTS